MLVPPGLEDAPPRVRRALGWSAAEGTLFSVMDGLAGPGLGLYAVALGMPDLVVGLLGSLPWLAGSLSQLLCPWLEQRFGSRKRAILAGGLVHALAMAAIPWVESVPPGTPRAAALLAVACLSLAGFLVTVPLWASWMGDLLPPLARERCMAWRALPAQLGMAAGVLAMGEWMHAHEGAGRGTLEAFRTLFLVAAGFRLAGLVCMALQYEPPAREERRKEAESGSVPVPVKGLGRVAAFFAVFHLVLFVSAPYFNPYMRMAGLDYRRISWILAVSFPVKMLFLPAWARAASRYGSRRVILVSGMLTSILPLLWAVPGGWAYLVGVQVLNGMVWGGIELCEIPYLLSLMTPQECTRRMAGYFSLRSLADCLGALGGDFSMGRARAWGWSASAGLYRYAFLLSGLGRAVAVLAAAKSLPETAPESRRAGPWRLAGQVAAFR